MTETHGCDPLCIHSEDNGEDCCDDEDDDEDDDDDDDDVGNFNL